MGCLDEVVIAAPCPVSWDSMLGDDRVRHCCGCAKNVYNIADMTKMEAEEFLAENGSSQCMRIFRRTDGTIMTDNCPRALRAIRNKLSLCCRFVAGMTAAFFAFIPAGKGQEASGQGAGNNKVPAANESKPAAPIVELSGEPMPPANQIIESKGDSAFVRPQSNLQKSGRKQIMLGNEGCQPAKSQKSSTSSGAATEVKSASPPQPSQHPRMGRAIIRHKSESASNIIEETGIPKKSDSRAYKVYLEGKNFEEQGKILLAQAKYKEAVNLAKKQDQGDPKFLTFLQNCLKNLEAKIAGTPHK